MQLLFNVADVAVLGIAGYDVGPVGSTGSLINLVIGLFVGLSVSFIFLKYGVLRVKLGIL